MPSYDQQKLISKLNLTAHQSAADNTNLAAAFIVPDGKTALVLSLEGYVTTGSGASDTIEIVRSDAATTALAEVDVNTTGVVKDSTTTFPITVRNNTGADIAVLFRSNGALGASADAQVFCKYIDPGAA